jgi:uncharacterized protein (TIGR02466 family)
MLCEKVVMSQALQNTLLLFSTPVFIYDEYTDPDFIFDTMDTQKNMRPNMGGNAMSQDTYLLDNDAYSMIRTRIQRGLQQYVRDVLRINERHQFNITQSWLNVNPAGTHHHVHVHRNSIISGTYYIDVSDSGSISFQAPFAGQSITDNNMLRLDIDEDTIANCNCWQVAVRNNDILFWPSQVPHKVPVNKTDRNRVSISFNVFVSGDLGTELGLEQLHIAHD